MAFLQQDLHKERGGGGVCVELLFPYIILASFIEFKVNENQFQP